MRHIILDTETTGIDPKQGHRIIEIGAVETLNYVPTANTFHVHLNPERDIEPEATAVHGITNEDVADKPLFVEVADAFIAFIGDDPLVIHNAPFDMGFLNAELVRIGKPSLPLRRAIDTLHLARCRFPGAPNSLDALCRRFNVDNSARTKHGALLDAVLLADVFLELEGGRQPTFATDDTVPTRHTTQTETETVTDAAYDDAYRGRQPKRHTLSDAEKAAHAAMLDGFTDPLWRRIASIGEL
jgi:DNA polymerase-3 subunit epsilon